ncbi:MAG: hypothetical protein WCK89_19660 [bacterium]
MSVDFNSEPARSIKLVYGFMKELKEDSGDSVRIKKIVGEMANTTIRCWECGHEFVLLYATNPEDHRKWLVCPGCQKPLTGFGNPGNLGDDFKGFVVK